MHTHTHTHTLPNASLPPGPDHHPRPHGRRVRRPRLRPPLDASPPLPDGSNLALITVGADGELAVRGVGAGAAPPKRVAPSGDGARPPLTCVAVAPAEPRLRWGMKATLCG